MKTEIGQKRVELANIRNWMTDQLLLETDRETRDYLFEARQAIGFSLLHLERVEYRTITISESQVESPPSQSETGG
jgi:hypothetical protein